MSKIIDEVDDGRTLTIKMQFEKSEHVKEYEAEDTLSADISNQNWAVAWTGAIALAWQSDENRKQLIDNPKAFLKAHLGYTVPSTVELLVREDDGSYFHPSAGNRPNDWTWELSKNVLIVNLPRKPENETQAAVALAAYQAVGMTYPFTLA